MLGMLILMEFALVVISPDDFPILAHRPISSRTFLAVRFSNLMFYILILGSSLSLGPAFCGLLSEGARWYFPLIYLAVSLLADLFVAASVVALYGLLIRWLNYERLKDVLMYCQIAFSFLIFLGYQFIPHFLITQNAGHVEMVSHKWGLLFPPVWFADMIELALGHITRAAVVSAALGLVVLLLILPVIFRAISLDYSDRLARMITVSGKPVASSAPVRRLWGSRLLSFFFPNQQERAFFAFISIMFRRNRRFKMQLLPQYGSMFAILVILALDRENHSQFTAMSASFTTMAFAMGAATLVALLPYSDEFAGAWVFHAAPLLRQDSILRAIKKAAAFYIFIPILVLYLFLFQFVMPRPITLKLGIYGFLSGWLLFEISLFQFHDFPFSRKIEKAVPTRQLTLVMFVFPLMIVAFLIPMLLAHSRIAILSVLALMAALNILLARFNRRRFSSRNLLPES
jgi:ABC-2 type transport system permease protein